MSETVRHSDHSETIGRFCRPHFLTLSTDEKVGPAIARVRRSARPGNIFYLYVTNARRELCGIVSIRSLLLADDQESISRVYSPKFVALHEQSDVRQAYEVFAKSRFLSLPIIDSENHILGVVHAHEIAGDFAPPIQDALSRDEIRRELFELLGVKAEDAGHSPTKVAAGRLPWLLVNLIGGGLCASLIHWLGGNLKNAVEILAFVPVLLVVSESIGMQTASLAIATLHRATKPVEILNLLAREWAIASLLGCACAVLLGTFLFLIRGSFMLSLAIAGSIILGCLQVSLVGNLIPLLFHRWKIDPRVAAGPVVLSVADFSTLLIYLIMARLLGPFL